MRLEHKLLIDYYAGGALHALLKPWVVLLGRALKRDHDLSRCREVTFLKLMGGGSLVIAYPALLGLRRCSRVRALRLITSPAVRPFAESLGVFDEITVIDDRGMGRLLSGSAAELCRLFRTGALVDLEIHSRLTTVFSLLSCARNRVGFYTMDSFWRRELSTHLLFCNVSSGIHHFYDQVAGLFGTPVPRFEDCIAEFRRSCGAEARERRRGVIGVAPCCSDLGRERMLGPAAWADILIARAPRTVILYGTRGDRPFLEELSDALRARGAKFEILNRGGERKLIDVVREIASLEELQCIDSALLHYARLLGVKTVSYWGPTDPSTRLRDWAGCEDEVHYAGLPCSPCVHLSYSSPCHGNNVCMAAACARTGHALNPAWLAVPQPLREKEPVTLPVLPS